MDDLMIHGPRAYFLPFSSILHDQAKVLPVSSTVVYRGAVVVDEEVDAIEGWGTITRERKEEFNQLASRSRL